MDFVLPLTFTAVISLILSVIFLFLHEDTIFYILDGVVFLLLFIVWLITREDIKE